MSIAPEKKKLCSTCQKTAGILTCRGCRKEFCYRHVVEHRQELNKLMDEVATNHDQLQQTIVEQKAQPNGHPVMKKIDEWEQQSVNKIHQAADNARKEFLNILNTYKTQVTNDLACLSTELSKAYNDDNYDEIDLEEWTEKLNALKTDLAAAHTIIFGRDNDENTLIPKLFIRDASIDTFNQTVGNVQIIEDGRTVVHDPKNNSIVAARCGGEYSYGRHRFHFQTEQLSSNNGFSCGVVSKNTSLSSIFRTSDPHKKDGYYSYMSETYSRLNHNVIFSFHNQNYNFQKGDTYELLIDCSRRLICLTNKRTRDTHQLDVSLITCPFPWQFFITLLYGNDRVCLC